MTKDSLAAEVNDRISELQLKWAKEITLIKAYIDSPAIKEEAVKLDKDGEPVREIKATSVIRDYESLWEIKQVMPEYKGIKIKVGRVPYLGTIEPPGELYLNWSETKTFRLRIR